MRGAATGLSALDLVDAEGRDGALGWPLEEGWLLVIGANDWGKPALGADDWDGPDEANGVSNVETPKALVICLECLLAWV